jgi:hypothetical protein
MMEEKSLTEEGKERVDMCQYALLTRLWAARKAAVGGLCRF